MVDQLCFAREQNNTGWLDECYKVHKLSGDSSSVNDYFQLEHYATATSDGPWTLTNITLESTQSGSSSPMSWMDWSPRSDQDVGNCQSIEIGISVEGAGLTAVHN
ncbi:MAG: hypothetical protein ACREQ3_27595, partial [Candidatus Binatia bacterium]